MPTRQQQQQQHQLVYPQDPYARIPNDPAPLHGSSSSSSSTNSCIHKNRTQPYTTTFNMMIGNPMHNPRTLKQQDQTLLNTHTPYNHLNEVHSRAENIILQSPKGCSSMQLGLS